MKKNSGNIEAAACLFSRLCTHRTLQHHNSAFTEFDPFPVSVALDLLHKYFKQLLMELRQMFSFES